jgi:hypothetical protein
MKLVLGLAAGALMLFQASANAQDMQAGQQACGNDVFALCQQSIPDRGRIEACLRANFRRVSPTCRAYMASYGKKRSRYASRHHERHASHYDRHHHYSSRHRKHRHDES